MQDDRVAAVELSEADEEAILDAPDVVQPSIDSTHLRTGGACHNDRRGHGVPSFLHQRTATGSLLASDPDGDTADTNPNSRRYKHLSKDGVMEFLRHAESKHPDKLLQYLEGQVAAKPWGLAASQWGSTVFAFPQVTHDLMLSMGISLVSLGLSLWFEKVQPPIEARTTVVAAAAAAAACLC